MQCQILWQEEISLRLFSLDEGCKVPIVCAIESSLFVRRSRVLPQKYPKTQTYDTKLKVKIVNN